MWFVAIPEQEYKIFPFNETNYLQLLGIPGKTGFF